MMTYWIRRTDMFSILSLGSTRFSISSITMCECDSPPFVNTYGMLDPFRAFYGAKQNKRPCCPLSEDDIIVSLQLSAIRMNMVRVTTSASQT